MNKHIHVAFDLDGVLGKFDEKIIELTGEHPSTLDRQGKLWRVVENIPNFFYHLDPYPEMIELVHEVKAHGIPIRVITGRPRRASIPTATQDKLNWCKKYLGSDIDVIVCLSRDKPKHMQPNVVDILIDDMEKNINNWRLHGGYTIHHMSYGTTRTELFNFLNIES